MTANRRYSVLSALALLAAFYPHALINAGEYVAQQGPATLRLALENPKAPGADRVFKKVEDGLVESRLANTMLLTLSIEGNAPLIIEGGDEKAVEKQIETLKSAGLWYRCEAVGKPTRTATGNGRERWEATFRLSALGTKESTVELSPLPIHYTERPGANKQRAAFPSVKVRFTTTVESVEPKGLRDITPPEEPPPPPPSWTRWLRWAGIAVAGLGLLAGAWGLRHRLTGPARPLAPHEWAVREFDRIESLRLPESGEVERYHTLLSDVMRSYLERRFDLPASQQTTAEFLDTMHRSPQLTPAQQHLLRDFLSRCDMAKFARAVPPQEECRAVAEMARSFVQETTPRPA